MIKKPIALYDGELREISIGDTIEPSILPSGGGTISSTAPGIEVTNGVISLTSGYIVPTETSIYSKAIAMSIALGG